MILAGSGYLIDTLANALLTSYAHYRTAFALIVAVPSVVGELAFTICLLLRGGMEEEARPSNPEGRDRAAAVVGR